MRAVLPLLALVALLAGCQTAQQGYVQVPRVTPWVQPTDAKVYTQADVLATVAQHAPGAVVDTSDVTFVAISHEWLEQFLPRAREFGLATGLLDWSAEVWDCDDIADLVSTGANVAAKHARVRAQPLFARIFVTQGHAFGNVPAGGAHALNALFTDRPPHYWVLEPQSLRGAFPKLVPLSEYPNRQLIFRVKIGK